jgi:hypothetical protein
MPHCNGSDIKTDLLLWNVCFSGVFPGDPAERLLFFEIDRAVGWTESVRVAGFNFDDDDFVAIPGDDISLGVSGGQAVVPRDDYETLTPEVPVDQILATTASGLVSGPEAAAFPIAETIEQGSDHPLSPSAATR